MSSVFLCILIPWSGPAQLKSLKCVSIENEKKNNTKQSKIQQAWMHFYAILKSYKFMSFMFPCISNNWIFFRYEIMCKM